MWTPDQSTIITAQQRDEAARVTVSGAIKSECRRRILEIMSEDQQRNTLAAGQAAMMQYGNDPADWPVELQTRHVSAMTAWAEIERLRARSNEIENMSMIPDVSDDEVWK